MIQKLINEFFDHLDVMSKEEGFNSDHWDKFSELSDNLIQKVPKFPGDADKQSISKVFKQLNMEKILKKADKIHPDVLLMLKEAYPPEKEYNYFDSGIAVEFLQLFDGNKAWHEQWKQTSAIHRKISSYEYVPDKKKIPPLKELAQGAILDPWINVLKHYKPHSFSDIDPQRMIDRDRPVKMSLILLLTETFKQERLDFLETFIAQTEDENDLIHLHEILSQGDTSYHSLNGKIIEKLKQLNNEAFALEVLEKSGVEPNWLENPGMLSLEVNDKAYDKGYWAPTAVTFSVNKTNQFDVQARIKQEDVTLKPIHWEPKPENIQSHLDAVAKQIGISLDWSTLSISSGGSKKDKQKIKNFISGGPVSTNTKPKSDAISQTEEAMNRFLDPEVTSIGSLQESKLIKEMKKLPSGIDTQKLYDVILKMGGISLFRYIKNMKEEYLPVVKKAVDHFKNDSPYSLLMIDCLQRAIEDCLNDTSKFPDFVETAAYLQYINSLSMTAYSASDLARADKFITKAVAENAGKTLSEYAYEDTDYIENNSTIFSGGDIIAFNLLFYALGKMNLPLVDEAVQTQLRSNPKSRELYCVLSTLEPNKDLENNRKAWQLVHQALTKAEKERIPYQLAQQIGLSVQPTDSWRIYITVGNDETSYVRSCSGFIGIDIRSIWSDYLKVEIQKNHSLNSYDYKSANDKFNFDPFSIRTEIERLALLEGIEGLVWEKTDILVVGLDKNTKKQIKNWLNC